MAAAVPLREAIDLDPRPDSAGAGRRFLRVTLTSWACPEDTATQAALVAGELLTNAILHAGTPLTLEIGFCDDIVRVAVRDYSPVVPVIRSHRPDAITGRGLDVVATLSRSWGIDPCPDGKVVWAEVDGAGPLPTVDPPPAAAPRPTPEFRRPVRVFAVPVAAFLTMQSHHEAILRELELVALESLTDPAPSSTGWPHVVRLARQVSPVRDVLRCAAEEAAGRGHDVADLVVGLRGAEIEALREWMGAMEEAEELCRAGQLLTPPAPPDILAIRHHLIEQLDVLLLDAESAESVEGRRDERRSVLPAEASADAGSQFRLAFDQSTVGMAFADADGRLRRVNRALCDLLGRSEDALLAGTFADLIPPDDSGTAARRFVRPDGSEVWGLTTVRAVGGSGRDPGWVMVEVHDATEIRRMQAGQAAAERVADRLARLQAATARLSDVRTMADVSAVVLDELTRLVGADQSGLWALSGDGAVLELMGAVDYPPELRDRFARYSVDTDTPAGDAVRKGRPVTVASRVERDRRYPTLADVTTDTELSHTLPLQIEGRAIGVLSFSWREAPVLDEEQRRFINAVGDQCAQALDRARLYEAQQRAVHHQEFLAEASRVLAVSLDFNATVARVVRLVVPELADACSLMVVEQDQLRPVAHSAVDPVKEALLRSMSERSDATDIDWLARVARTGEAVVNPTIEPEVLEAASLDEDHRRQLQILDIRSAMAVPLMARGHAVGLMGLQMTGDSDRRYRADDVELVLDLADRVAIALDNARTYQLRNEVADTLQRSLLPPHLPDIPGAELAARYVPGLAGVEVGGDFYDVFDTGGDWALVLGDVCGKGARAAALTAMARYSLRAAAIQDPQPATILNRLNETLLRQSEDERFCTVIYARLVPTSRGMRVTVSAGGHPLPLVVRADGTVHLLGGPGGLLGLFPEIRLVEETTELGPGDALVLYTDGVTEAHRDRELFGDERLAAVLASRAGQPAETIADAVQEAVDGFVSGPRRDDLALLVMRISD